MSRPMSRTWGLLLAMACGCSGSKSTPATVESSSDAADANDATSLGDDVGRDASPEAEAADSGADTTGDADAGADAASAADAVSAMEDAIPEASAADVVVDAADVTTGLWSFDSDLTNGAPDGFRTALGLWLVQNESTAPSPSHVLRQLNALSDTDYPRIFVSHATLADGTVRVRCRPEDGAIDRACGLAFRAVDDDYYVARANALENNVNLYVVVAGNRALIATANASVTSGDWHLLEVTVSGSRIAVRWDGAGVLSTTDATYASGRIGLWTKSDSVTAFDDLELTP